MPDSFLTGSEAQRAANKHLRHEIERLQLGRETMLRTNVSIVEENDRLRRRIRELETERDALRGAVEAVRETIADDLQLPDRKVHLDNFELGLYRMAKEVDVALAAVRIEADR